MIYRNPFGGPVWRVKSPFDQLDRMRRQMDRLLNTFAEGAPEQAGAGVYPAVNLTEDKNNYYVRAELPGVDKDALELKVTEKTLNIVGERKIQNESEEARYHRRERDAGKFSRAVAMPGEINAEGVGAKLANGVLTITVPKAEKAKPRQITIA